MNRMQHGAALAALTLGLALPGAGFAQPSAENTATQQEGAFTDGEVKKIDAEGGKLTLKHGEIANLGMPGGMTMIFRVSDKGLLDGLKPGDQVQFTAAEEDGKFMVTAIRPAS